MFQVAPHPLLDLRGFVTRFPKPLGELSPDADLLDLLTASAGAPLQSNDTIREAIRRLLRQGGFKPTGRSKPASEYLIKAAGDGRLESINLAVDACNAVSLHSGIPISVVDLDLVQPPLRVAIAPAGANYIFNASGQVIDVAGLLCLFDAQGPCANAVKDAQRTKTGTATRSTLSLLWGTIELPGQAAEAETWYRALLEQHGSSTESVS
jgi:DNA/RNA-binding domain of Phe-tRNA-synthetase-like protein